MKQCPGASIKRVVIAEEEWFAAAVGLYQMIVGAHNGIRGG